MAAKLTKVQKQFVMDGCIHGDFRIVTVEALIRKGLFHVVPSSPNGQYGFARLTPLGEEVQRDLLASEAEPCIACGKPLLAGDEYLPDISGGSIHLACCGPEPEGFVDLETGEPLPEPPKPLVWDADRTALSQHQGGTDEA